MLAEGTPDELEIVIGSESVLIVTDHRIVENGSGGFKVQYRFVHTHRYRPSSHYIPNGWIDHALLMVISPEEASAQKMIYKYHLQTILDSDHTE